MACDNLSGWPTASKVHFVTYRVDSSSNPVAGTQLDCYGIVSGNSITSFTVIDGTDLGNSVGDYVEMLPTAAWGQDLADALTNEHNRNGTHGAITTTSINNAGTLTQTGVATFTAVPVFPSNTVTTAEIQADAVTDAKLIYGKVRSRQGGSATNWSTPGTSNFDYSATDTFEQVGVATGNAGSDVTITFGVAFSQVPIVTGSNFVTNSNTTFIVATVSATQFTFRMIDSGGVQRADLASWRATGQ